MPETPKSSWEAWPYRFERNDEVSELNFVPLQDYSVNCGELLEA